MQLENRASAWWGLLGVRAGRRRKDREPDLTICGARAASHEIPDEKPNRPGSDDDDQQDGQSTDRDHRLILPSASASSEGNGGSAGICVIAGLRSSPTALQHGTVLAVQGVVLLCRLKPLQQQPIEFGKRQRTGAGA